MLLLLWIQGEGRVVGKICCLLRLLLLLLRLGALLVCRVVSILRIGSILLCEGWVRVEEIRIPGCVLGRVSLKILLSKACRVAH